MLLLLYGHRARCLGDPGRGEVWLIAARL